MHAGNPSVSIVEHIPSSDASGAAIRPRPRPHPCRAIALTLLAALLLPQWEKVDNKPAFVVYSVAAFSAIWLSSTVVGALNHLPVVSPPALRLQQPPRRPGARRVIRPLHLRCRVTAPNPLAPPGEGEPKADCRFCCVASAWLLWGGALFLGSA